MALLIFLSIICVFALIYATFLSGKSRGYNEAQQKIETALQGIREKVNAASLILSRFTEVEPKDFADAQSILERSLSEVAENAKNKKKNVVAWAIFMVLFSILILASVIIFF